ncbi:multidrug effflux MFS transporter [Pectinatus sottacetonis]|uniref:multidrug effflux MFS transporter n=1 Tax=Pectinatus sottacetonis TaxID=1002795 RepID=UPI0018C4A2EC|nr:multidrug effflux MFS transporter [Pectinatus sottacetonis]
MSLGENKTGNTKNTGKMLIILLAAIAAIGPLATDMYLPALPEVCTQLNTSASYVQLTLTAWLIGLAFGQVVVGPLSDIIGRKKPLIMGLLVFSAAAAGCVVVTSIKIFIVIRLIGGFAGAAALVVSRAIASDLYSGSLLTKFLATIMVIQGLAPIFAPVIGGQLLLFFSWRSIFTVLTIIGIIIVILGMFFYKESLPEEKRISGRLVEVTKVFIRLCCDHFFVGICAIQFFVFSALFAYISGMPFILQNIYGFSPQKFSMVFAVVGIGMAISGQLTNFLAGKIKEEKLLFYGLLQGVIFGTIFLLGILQNWNIYILIIFLLLTETALPNIAATSFSLAMKGRADKAGSVSALLGFFSMISGGLIAPVVGVGGPNTALPTAITILVCELAALVIFLRFIKGRML